MGIKGPFCFNLQDQKEVFVLEACVFGRAVTQARQQCCHQASEGNKNQADEADCGNVQAELGLNTAGSHVRLTSKFLFCLQGKVSVPIICQYKAYQNIISLNKDILFNYVEAPTMTYSAISL